jgi:hypothetical protein
LALATRPGAEIAYASVAQAPTGELIVGTLDATTGLYGFDVYARPGGPLAGSYALPGAYRFAAWDERFLLANMTGYDVGTGDDGTSYPVLVDRNAGTAQPFVSDVFTKQRGRNRFVAFVPGAPVP